jgi:hypothetical protein
VGEEGWTKWRTDYGREARYKAARRGRQSSETHRSITDENAVSVTRQWRGLYSNFRSKMSTASSQFVLLLGHGEDSRAVAQAVFATLLYSFVIAANIYFWLAPFLVRNKRPQHAPTTPDLQSPRSESPDAKPVPDLEVAGITATKSSLGRYSSSSTGEAAPSENSNK